MELPTQIGKYRVLQSLGQGACGFVLKVEQEIIQRVVAMKVLFAHLIQAKPILIRRFKREARLASSLIHPNIVPIFEIGEADGMHYYTMQCIDGVPMTKYVQDTSISFNDKMYVCLELCDALALAHKRNIIHRDMKPHNVIIAKDMHPVILDFGIAKSLIEEEQMTQSGHILGSAHYMAPEQAGTGTVGTHSDVFALGVMIYELMTGVRPFQGNNVTQLIVDRIQYREKPEQHKPPSMLQMDPTIPKVLNQIVFHCLEADPNKRYKNAGELLLDLKKLRKEWNFLQGLKDGSFTRYRDILPIKNKTSYLYPIFLAVAIFLFFCFLGFWVHCMPKSYLLPEAHAWLKSLQQNWKF